MHAVNIWIDFVFYIIKKLSGDTLHIGGIPKSNKYHNPLNVRP